MPGARYQPWSYAEPFGWWGFSSEGQGRSIIELIRADVLTARVAAFLWLALEHRASLVVAAEPHGAGKTTLLTALLDFLPAGAAPTYLRGWYERFEFLNSTTPESAYLLCNEISQHLPTYLWGRGVRRVFEAARQGYGLATTMHASSAAEVLALLTAYPLEVPVEDAAAIDFVLTVGVGQWRGEVVRRLLRLEQVRLTPDGVLIEPLAERDVLLSALESRPGQLVGVLSGRFGLEAEEAAAELARREQFLARLVAQGVTAPDAVRAAIQAFR
ncbi:MAG TPA: type II secretion system protein E [Thermomicrobiaceae bacterium]|nr:type II secretion system protein E [Thermomicrobiaceae bacterium]